MLINRDVQTAVLEGYGGKNYLLGVQFSVSHSCSSTTLEAWIIFTGIKTPLPTNLLSQTRLNYSENKIKPRTGKIYINLYKRTALTNP